MGQLKSKVVAVESGGAVETYRQARPSSFGSIMDASATWTWRKGTSNKSRDSF